MIFPEKIARKLSAIFAASVLDEGASFLFVGPRIKSVEMARNMCALRYTGLQRLNVGGDLLSDQAALEVCRTISTTEKI